MNEFSGDNIKVELDLTVKQCDELNRLLELGIALNMFSPGDIDFYGNKIIKYLACGQSEGGAVSSDLQKIVNQVPLGF